MSAAEPFKAVVTSVSVPDSRDGAAVLSEGAQGGTANGLVPWRRKGPLYV
jgi:hypothetical protein